MTETIFLLRLVLAAILGAIIGFEREKAHRPAGLRTHIIVCVSACLVTMIGLNSKDSDPMRIAANVLTGIGFIGAGTIIASSGSVKGVTTAASIFSVAGIGIAVAAGFYLIAIFTTILIFVVLWLRKIEKRDNSFLWD
ncbi:MAG: MgtC/SapB family protein [Candidatus Aenigmarchaeota archaeon]|nr:MgtC/SapB family protein [Candidatus Aenigmarchaeota archaeon]MCX8179409.1 MgtC/SapB family protein [Candidatus Aenigmarchaeota archaeon]